MGSNHTRERYSAICAGHERIRQGLDPLPTQVCYCNGGTLSSCGHCNTPHEPFVSSKEKLRRYTENTKNYTLPLIDAISREIAAG